VLQFLFVHVDFLKLRISFMFNARSYRSYFYSRLLLIIALICVPIIDVDISN